MFEKYTEKARRVIFFARYECSTDGSSTIESHHLLIGLMRESTGLLALYLDSLASQGEIRAEIAKLTTIQEPRPPIPTSVDLPLSEECKHILAFSAEEAERLGHVHIGTEHLLLGILREENCLATRLLRDRGLSLEHAREVMVASEKEGAVKRGLGSGGGVLGSRGPLSQRQPLPTIRLVDVTSSESLLTYQQISFLPRIGDAIRIRDADGAELTCRVQDIVWEFTRNADFSLLEHVEVKVVREDGVDGGLE